jgi:hypothetical protein
MPGANDLSKLHYEYSINKNPNINGKPEPSQLDLDGITPPKYTERTYQDNRCLYYLL